MNPEENRWNAADYAANSSAQKQWALELFDKLSVKGREHLLDIGCGDGTITAGIARRLPEGRVCGIDLSEDMIRLAAEKHPPEDYPNLIFRQMDARAINLTEKFDIAFSNAVLHWVDSLPGVFRGVHTCLNHGGRILFQMGGRGNATEISHAVEEVIGHRKWKNFFQNFTFPYHFYGPEECDAWLREAGFQAVRAELIPKDMQHQNAEELKGWLRTTWFPYTDRVPAGQRNDFLEDILKNFLARHPVDSAGRTHVSMIRLEIEATARR